MDEHLNSSDGSGLMPANSKDDVVEKEHGSSKADIAVNEAIGVEMKRELSNSQNKKLRGQIEDYLDNYNFFIVCACGIDDISGWRKLKNKYEGSRGIEGGEVVFIHKKKENFGKEKSKKQRNSSGTGLF